MAGIKPTASTPWNREPISPIGLDCIECSKGNDLGWICGDCAGDKKHRRIEVKRFIISMIVSLKKDCASGINTLDFMRAQGIDEAHPDAEESDAYTEALFTLTSKGIVEYGNDTVRLAGVYARSRSAAHWALLGI